jgi:hypothetical protein
LARSAGHIAVAPGEEIEDMHEPIVSAMELGARPDLAGARRQLRPGGARQTAIFRQTSLAEHVGISFEGAVERVVVAFHLTCEQIAGEGNRIGPRRLRGGKMNVARALQQCAALPLGIIDLVDGRFDPVDRPLDKPQRHAGALARGKFDDGTERRLHTRGPISHFAVTDVVCHAGRAVDRLAQACLDGLVVAAHRRRCHIEPAKQRRVPLGDLHDHCHEGVDALRLQMIANPAEHAGAVGLCLAAEGIGRERHRDHVLAEAPVLECAAGARAIDLLAAPGEFRAVVFRACDLRQHPLRFDAENDDMAGATIVLAARERFCPGQLAQGVDVKTRRCPGFHIGGRSTGSASISRSASSSGTAGCRRHHCPVCLCHMTSKRVSAMHSATWSRRAKAASNSSPALSGKPDRKRAMKLYLLPRHLPSMSIG